mgnify:FL=1
MVLRESEGVTKVVDQLVAEHTIRKLVEVDVDCTEVLIVMVVSPAPGEHPVFFAIVPHEYILYGALEPGVI